MMNEFIIYFLVIGLSGMIVELITAKIEKRVPTALSVITSILVLLSIIILAMLAIFVIGWFIGVIVHHNHFWLYCLKER